MKTIGGIIQVAFFYWVLTMLGACGQTADDLSSPKDATEQQDKDEAAGEDSTDGEGSKKHVSGGYLQGYVVSAFDMTVDDKQYLDSEDFYTQQLGRIEDEAREGGYEGYTIKFDAQIGLDDLKRGMKVYVVSTQDQGYAADTKINEKGRFQMSIPAEGVEDTYKIRTNKRVNVILTSEDKKDVVKWCYNFSGLETEASVEAPAIINKFQSRLTRYACTTGSDTGITVPAKEVTKEETDSEAPADADAEVSHESN